MLLLFWYQVANMKALLQTLNKTLIYRYGLIIGLVTAVPKKKLESLGCVGHDVSVGTGACGIFQKIDYSFDWYTKG